MAPRGLQLLRGVDRCRLEELRYHAWRHRHIVADSQVRKVCSPYDLDLRLLFTLPPAQPRFHLGPAFMLDQGCHRPGLEMGASQRGVERRRSCGAVDKIRKPGLQRAERFRARVIAPFSVFLQRSENTHSCFVFDQRPLLVGLRLALRIGPHLRSHAKDLNERTAAPASVYPSQTLHHALKGNEVADHVIRVHVDANLPCGSGHQEDWRVRRRFGTAEQPNLVEPCLDALPFSHSARAHEEFRLSQWNVGRLFHSCPDLPVNQLLHFHGVPTLIAIDNDTPRHSTET